MHTQIFFTNLWGNVYGFLSAKNTEIMALNKDPDNQKSIFPFP